MSASTVATRKSPATKTAAKPRKATTKPKAETKPAPDLESKLAEALAETKPEETGERWSTKGSDAEEAECRYCHEVKPVDQFFLHRASGKHHVRARCRECEKSFRAERRERGLDGHAKRQAEVAARKAEREAAKAAKAAAAPATTKAGKTGKLLGTVERRGSKWLHIITRDGEEIARRTSDRRYRFYNSSPAPRGAIFSEKSGDVEIVEA